MDQPTCQVVFDGHPVAVSSEAPEVLAGFVRTFQPMLGRNRSEPVDRLEVRRYGKARYRLRGDPANPAGGRTLSDVLCRLGQEVVARLIRARPNLLWLHAGAAALGGRAVVVVGVSGRGKSTLVTSLWSLGWSYLSDDILPLDPRTGCLMPFPQTPSVRQDPGGAVPPERVAGLGKVTVEIPPEAVARAAVPVGAVVFPRYRPGQPAELTPCAPAEAALALLQSCLNFGCHREAAVQYLCDLVRTVPAWSLSFADGRRAAELVAAADAPDRRGRLWPTP